MRIGVLYLSYDGLTDPLGQSQILPYIIGLSKRSYDFTVISFEKTLLEKKYGRDVAEICSKHSIKWIPLRYHKNPPVISTLFDLYILWRRAKKKSISGDYQIVHCRSYLPGLIGLSLKKSLNLKFLFDMRGFWPDERVEGGLWNLKNPVYRSIYNYFKRRETVLFRQSDYIISLTKNARNHILKNFLPETSVVPVSVIPCCVDLTLFDPHKIMEKDKTALREQLGLARDQWTLLYIGSLGTWYLIEEMFQFFRMLKKQVINAKFLVITPDLHLVPDDQDIIARSVHHDLVPLYCCISTASIAFIKPSFSKIASSATKIAEAIAMRLPVITNMGWGDVEDQASYGLPIILVKDFSKIEFDKAIDALSVYSTEKFSQLYFEKLYSIDQGCNSYDNAYRELMLAKLE